MEISRKYRELTVLIGVNLFYVLTVELVSGRHLVQENVFQNLVAGLFVLLSFVRIFTRYGISDPVIRQFLRACLAAMLVLAGARIVGGPAEPLLRLEGGAVFLLKSLYYSGTLLLILLGAESMMRVQGRGERAGLLAILFVLVSAVTSVSMVGFAKGGTVGAVPLLLAILLLAFLGLGSFARLRGIGRMMSVLSPLTGHLSVACLLVAVAPMAGLLSTWFKLSSWAVQAVNLEQFLFVASMSVMFLGFGQMKSVGGVYSQMKET